MVPTKKEDLRKLVSETTMEVYEELTPQLMYPPYHRLLLYCKALPGRNMSALTSGCRSSGSPPRTGGRISLRKLVSETTMEVYEELTPQLIRLIEETKRNDTLTEGQKQDEISLHMIGYVKSCTNEIIIDVLAEILGLEG